MRKTKILYQIFTYLLCLLLLPDGFGGVTQQQAGQDVLQHLGYPMYFLIISGVAKWLAIIAILQTKFTTIKEWAYAGISINFVGASASRLSVGDSFFETIFPIFMLGFMFISYFFWKKLKLQLLTDNILSAYLEHIKNLEFTTRKNFDDEKSFRKTELK